MLYHRATFRIVTKLEGIKGSDVFSAMKKIRDVDSLIANSDIEIVREPFFLSKVNTLFDISIIQHPQKIYDFIHTFNKTKSVYRSKIPSIKLLKTENNDLLLIGGHHEFLAYMATNIIYLHRVPHIIIERESGQGIPDRQILNNLGQYILKGKQNNFKDPSNYYINYQSNLLLKNKQNCMGDLYTEWHNQKFNNKNNPSHKIEEEGNEVFEGDL